MAIEVITNAGILIGGYNLTTLSNAASIKQSVDAKNSSVFGSSASRVKAGMKSASIGVAGFMEATSQDRVFFNNTSASDVPVTILPADIVTGAAGYSTLATLTNISMNDKIGELYTCDISAVSSTAQGVIYGKVLYSGTINATGGSGGVLVGTTSATQAISVHVHITGNSGTAPTLALTLQSDDAIGMGTATTIGTTGSLTSADSNTYYSYTFAGPFTDDYFQLYGTLGGSNSPSFTLTYFVGIS